MKKILSIICILGIITALLYACASVNPTGAGPVSVNYNNESEIILGRLNVDDNDVLTGSDTTSGKISLTEGEIAILKAELEEEKETDPIFDSMDGVDPPEYWDKWRNEEKLPDDFIERVGSQGIEDIMYAYARRLWFYEMATDEYNRYAYYYGNYSPYIEGVDESRSEYNSLLSAVSSGLYPDSILDICYPTDEITAPCITATVKKTLTTSIDASNYYTQEQLDKYYPDGNYLVEYKWFLLEVKECYIGELKKGDLIAFAPRGLNYDMINIFDTQGETFLIYLFKDGQAVDYNGKEMLTYSTIDYGVFDITDGTVKSYSDLNDIIQYEGLTPEEFVKVTLRLRAKYL